MVGLVMAKALMLLIFMSAPLDVYRVQVRLRTSYYNGNPSGRTSGPGSRDRRCLVQLAARFPSTAPKKRFASARWFS